MYKKIKSSFLTLLFSVALISPAVLVAPNQTVSASAKDAVCNGAAFANGTKGAECEEGAGENKINNAVNNVVNLFSWVVGVAAVFAVIYGGFQYVLSTGDPAKATKGRNTILYALAGLIIVGLAQVIVKFVVGSV